MKDFQRGKIVFECDSCSEVLETGVRASEWTEAKACFDDAGWRAKQIGSDWIHSCPAPNCQRVRS